jgi:hypothetical protein
MGFQIKVIKDIFLCGIFKISFYDETKKEKKAYKI